jgi:protein tyrosine phosphatase
LVDIAEEKNYINASYIKSAFGECHPQKNPFGFIICTQGPQDYSVDSFWQMVIENNVKKIVTLCHKIGDRGK